MLSNIRLEHLYDYEENPEIMRNFYIPVLQNTISYKRLTGEFSSASFATVAKGFSKFFFNGGKMRILSSVVIQKSDYEVIKSEKQLPSNIEKKILSSLDEMESLMIKNHLSVLAWLLKEKRLELRFILLKKRDRYIFHTKVGILRDESKNKVVFFGTLNESNGGWDGNGERFRVYKSWGEPYELRTIKEEEKNFEKKWKIGERSKSITFNITDAIEKRILKFKEDVPRKKCEEFLKKNSEDKFKLRDYQNDTLQEWIENEYRGIIPFETAGGKTITAIFGLSELYKNEIFNKRKNLLASLVVPSNVVAEQ